MQVRRSAPGEPAHRQPARPDHPERDGGGAGAIATRRSARWCSRSRRISRSPGSPTDKIAGELARYFQAPASYEQALQGPARRSPRRARGQRAARRRRSRGRARRVRSRADDRCREREGARDPRSASTGARGSKTGRARGRRRRRARGRRLLRSTCTKPAAVPAARPIIDVARAAAHGHARRTSCTTTTPLAARADRRRRSRRCDAVAVAIPRDAMRATIAVVAPMRATARGRRRRCADRATVVDVTDSAVAVSHRRQADSQPITVARSHVTVERRRSMSTIAESRAARPRSITLDAELEGAGRSLQFLPGDGRSPTCAVAGATVTIDGELGDARSAESRSCSTRTRPTRRRRSTVDVHGAARQRRHADRHAVGRRARKR